MEADPLPESTVRHMFKQIVPEVAALHQLGVSHGDLTLTNILIDRNLSIKIIDFGSAVVATQGVSPRNTFGTHTAEHYPTQSKDPCVTPL
ncbi:hypothetical protein BDW22DRAFT_1358013 [Trametopsis cervina]|nr:hypothetical protein BDW22DRAFT_1358013 [Trametopsis cervina]